MVLGTRGDVGGKMGNDKMVTINHKGWNEWQYNNGSNNSGNMGWQGIGVERKKFQMMEDVRKDAKGNRKHVRVMSRSTSRVLACKKMFQMMEDIVCIQ
jgi:hypothetical protein